MDVTAVTIKRMPRSRQALVAQDKGVGALDDFADKDEVDFALLDF